MTPRVAAAVTLGLVVLAAACGASDGVAQQAPTCPAPGRSAVDGGVLRMPVIEMRRGSKHPEAVTRSSSAVTSSTSPLPCSSFSVQNRSDDVG